MKKKLIIGTITTFVLIFGWVFYYNNFTFHATKVTPSPSDIASLTPSITLTMNKEVESVESIISAPSVSYIESYSFTNKTIKISLVDLPVEEKVTIKISSVRSVDGYTYNQTLSFTPKLKDADELSEEQYKELLEKQDRKTDVNADPIQALVPYSTNNYDLSLILKGKDDSGNNVYNITARIMLSAADVRINREAAITNYKNEITTYLSSNNIDINNYTFIYDIEEPSLY